MVDLTFFQEFFQGGPKSTVMQVFLLFSEQILLGGTPLAPSRWKKARASVKPVLLISGKNILRCNWRNVSVFVCFLLSNNVLENLVMELCWC